MSTQTARSRPTTAGAAAATAERKPVLTAVLLIVAGAIGMYGAFKLIVDKYDLLENPKKGLSCDINPFVSCTDVMNSVQSHLFGFPNPILGLAGFVAPIAVGLGILAGAKFARWYWIAFNAGLFLAWVFVTWLFTQTVFSIGALCPWCMLVWTATIPLFWIFTVWNLARGNMTANPVWQRRAAAFLPYSWVLPLINYIVVVLVIIVHFPTLLTALFG